MHGYRIVIIIIIIITIIIIIITIITIITIIIIIIIIITTTTTHRRQGRVGGGSLQPCTQPRKRRENHHRIRKHGSVRPQTGENEEYDARGVRHLPAPAKVKANNGVGFESGGGGGCGLACVGDCVVFICEAGRGVRHSCASRARRASHVTPVAAAAGVVGRLKNAVVKTAAVLRAEVAGLKQTFGSRQNFHEEDGTDPREEGGECKETERDVT